MASFKIKFRLSTGMSDSGYIYYQITHDGKVKNFGTSYRIYLNEWDPKHCMPVCTEDKSRSGYIVSVKNKILIDIKRINFIISRLSQSRLVYSADDIVTELSNYLANISLSNFMNEIISDLCHIGKVRTCEIYKTTLNSFISFSKGEDIMLDCITSETVSAYKAWHRAKGNSPNTATFYIRVLRATYNKAIEQGLIMDMRPFRRINTSISKTAKRALPLNIIQSIKNLDLSSFPTLDYARDMFMMSFYLRGMSFIDMAYLKKVDYVNGFILYRRRKTGQPLMIEWTGEMQNIVDKYHVEDQDYLLPILKTTEKREAYLKANYNINRSLKKVANIIGLKTRLTMHVARHSWASIANAKGIPLHIICEGLGHSSEIVTQIYLGNIDTSAVHNANKLIINALG